APLEETGDRLAKAWSPVGHMNSVVNTDELRQAYNACLPKLSAFATELGQNEELYRAYLQIHDGPEFKSLDPARQKAIVDALRDFRLAGVSLPQEQKERFKAINRRLSELRSKFEENVMDATDAWSKLIADETELAGLPPTALAAARQAAERKGEKGWLINLEFPSYYAVMTYADSRELRRE